MAHLKDVLAKLKKNNWSGYSGYDKIAKYVKDGSKQSLKAIPAAGQWPYWISDLASALHQPDKWTDEDRRLVHVIDHLNDPTYLWRWVDQNLAHESEGQDIYGTVAAEFKSRKPETIAAGALSTLKRITINGKPTSFGNHLLNELSDTQLEKVAKKAEIGTGCIELVKLLNDQAPKRLNPMLKGILGNPDWSYSKDDLLAEFLKFCNTQHEKSIARHVASQKKIYERFLLTVPLFEHAPDRYRDTMLKVSRKAVLTFSDECNAWRVAQWMAENLGTEVIPDLVKYSDKVHYPYYVTEMAKTARLKMGDKALPVLITLLDKKEPEMRNVGLEQIILLNDSANDDVIEEKLRIGLADSQTEVVQATLKLAQQWKPKRIMDALWKLLENKSKPVRSSGARSLAKCGKDAVENGIKLLTHKKADVRMAAVELLVGIGTDEAINPLEGRLDEETKDDVRDKILLGLEAAWKKQGREITKADIADRIKRSASKLENPVADWIDGTTLPPLKWSDGEKLKNQEVRYLLYRQSRAKEIVADPEAAAVYRMIDSTSSGKFAAAVFNAYLSSSQEASDRWALTIAGILGDDAIVPVLAPQIRKWVDAGRGKLAEYAVQALALLGTDAALLAVDALAIRYRSKMKNVGRAAAESFALAAERLGISPEELGDRVVPWLCFKPDETYTIKTDKTEYEVRIGLDFKLRYFDKQKNKAVKSLPKSVPDEIKGEMKETAANLREIIKAQTLRLENLLVRQRRWPVDEWKDLYLKHPVLLPYANRLVWSVYDKSREIVGLFRAMEDRTLTTAADDPYKLPKSVQIGIVHPLELSYDERTEWLNHFADYEIIPPFPQLDREVVLISDDQHKHKTYSEHDGKSINGMTFKGRAERLGWTRGSVVDAGAVCSYHKSFATAGVDVLIEIEGMYMGMDMYDDITLGNAYFLQGGSVTFGSYEYDEPSNESDSRVLNFGKVPEIVFSEAIGDLKRIAGKKNEEE